MIPDSLLTTAQAAKTLGLAAQTLAGWRSTNDPAGPPYVRIGRLIRYDAAVLAEWLQARTVYPGGQGGNTP